MGATDVQNLKLSMHRKDKIHTLVSFYDKILKFLLIVKN